MDVGGGFTLTPEQAAAWAEVYPDEYSYYVDEGLFDPLTGELLDEPPFWMVDGNPTNGPFDFNLELSHEEIHY